MMRHRYKTPMLVLFLLLGGQAQATEESKVYKSAKMRSYVPDNIVNEAYKRGHDAGYVSGAISKNIIYSTYKGSEAAGYSTGKAAKKLWRKLWN